MARHRAPDVASPLHGVHPTGTGRPRHAANQISRVSQAHAPAHLGRHRAGPALELVGPVVVVEIPEQPPAPTLIEVVPTPTMVRVAPAPEPAPPPVPDPEPSLAPGQPLAETVTWAGFAALVSCAVVAGGQGPREEGLWILGISGGVLTTVGLGLLGLRRLRRGQA